MLNNITRRKREIIGFAVFILNMILSQALYCEDNLILNGGFEESQQDAVAMWSEEAYVNSSDAVRFFLQDKDAHSGNNCLAIANLEPNDSWVVQWIKVKPDTFYKIAGWIRTVNVDESLRGATITVRGLTSATKDMRGSSSQWELIEVYGRTGRDQYTLAVIARLGFFANLTKGLAYFDDISIEEVSVVPPEKVIDFSADKYIDVNPDMVIGRGWQGIPIWIPALVLAGILVVLVVFIVLIAKGIIFKRSSFIQACKRLITNLVTRKKQDKRQYRRKYKKLDVCVTREMPDGMHKKIYLKTYDISLGGMFVASEDLSILNVEEIVSIVVSDKGEEVFIGRAMIVWGEALYDNQNTVVKSGFGFKFVNVEETEMERLQNKYYLRKT